LIGKFVVVVLVNLFVGIVDDVLLNVLLKVFVSLPKSNELAFTLNILFYNYNFNFFFY
jgi:hypothetical protein